MCSRASRPLTAACGLGSAGVRPLLREGRVGHALALGGRALAPRSDNRVRRSPRRDAARARPRTRPTRTLRCGRCPRCGGAVLCGRRASAAAPWRAPPGGLGAPPRRARGLWTPSVVCVRRCAAAWGAQEALGARAPLHPDRRRRALIGGTFFCPRSHTRPKYR